MDTKMEAHLENLLSELLRARLQNDPNIPSKMYLGLGALDALVLSGLMSDSDAAAWSERLRSAAGYELASPSVASTLINLSLVARQADAAEPADSTPSPSLSQFQGTVAIDRELGWLRILAIELYDDAIALRWHIVINGFPSDEQLGSGLPEELREALLGRLHLTDDVGTRYVMCSSGSFGAAPSVIRGEFLYTPGAPASAKELQMALRNQSVAVPLKHH